METLGLVTGIASLVAFSVFFSNVIAGAMFRAPFLNDVGEMLVLFVSAGLFVALILIREKMANRQSLRQETRL